MDTGSADTRKPLR